MRGNSILHPAWVNIYNNNKGNVAKHLLSFRQTQKQRFKTNAGSHILYTICYVYNLCT